MKSTFCLIVGAVTWGALSSTMHAQGPSRNILQATAGVSNSTGGVYTERDSYHLDVLFARRVRSHGNMGAIIGASVGHTFANGSDLTCPVPAGATCVPLVPKFNYASLLAGGEIMGKYGRLSMAGGPSVLSTTGSSHFGAQLRADVATPSVMRTALVFSPTVLFIPKVTGESMTVRNFTVGLQVR